jgi:hypothetical protein
VVWVMGQVCPSSSLSFVFNGSYLGTAFLIAPTPSASMRNNLINLLQVPSPEEEVPGRITDIGTLVVSQTASISCIR